MNEFPPNIDPENFSLSAVIIAYILENGYTANELNSIGNWLILLGQFMLTTAAPQQLINGRHSNDVGSRIRKDKNNHHLNNPEKANKNDINNIVENINKIMKDIEQIKKKTNF